MKLIVKIVIVVAMLVSITGCVQMALDSSFRSSEIDKSYADLEPLPPPIASNGRIFVYRTKESTQTELVYGSGLHRNLMNYIIDDQVFYLFWETFRYHDLPLGSYEISCGDVIKEGPTGSSPAVFQRGKQKLNISSKDNTVKYVRLELIEDKPTPVLVDATTAQKELYELMHMKYPDPIATTVD